MQLADTQSIAIVRSSSTTGGASLTYKDLNEAKWAQLHLETQIYLYELKSYEEYMKAIGRL
jgi:hypothetical protein